MWWMGLALAAPLPIESVDRVSGPLSARLAPADDADVVLLFAGEHGGRVGPCGCDLSPKGGLAALYPAVSAIRESQPGRVLLVNPGGYLSAVAEFGELTPRAVADNARFHEALYRMRFDALHVTYRDLAGTVMASHPGQVSASHRSSVPVARYKVFDLDGLKVAVTGVSRDGLPWLLPPGAEVREPVAAIAALLPELAAVDIVVVLAHEVPRLVPALAALDGVDVVIEAGNYPERWPALAQGDAVWVRSRAEGAQLGELRLWVAEGRVVRAVDRRITLDRSWAPDPALSELAEP